MLVFFVWLTGLLHTILLYLTGERRLCLLSNLLAFLLGCFETHTETFRSQFSHSLWGLGFNLSVTRHAIDKSRKLAIWGIKSGDQATLCVYSTVKLGTIWKEAHRHFHGTCRVYPMPECEH